MSEQSREQISALVDGELEDGAPFILNALRDSQEYRKIWHHYHLIGECLRDNLTRHVDMHLADRISRIIQNEPAIRSAAKTTTRNPLLKPVIGFAIAASVTVVVILGVKQAGIGPAATQAPTVAANHTETSAKYQVARITGEPSVPHQTQGYQASADAQSRLNRYLVNHNEYRSNAGVQGMLPYVRIVAHEVEE